MTNRIIAFFIFLTVIALVGCVEEGAEDTSSSSSTSTTPAPSNSNYPDKLNASYITPFNFDATDIPKVDTNSTATLNTELNNTIVATIINSNNAGYIDIIGDKNFNGLVETVRGACIITTTGEEIAVVLDDSERPSRLSGGNGKIVYFDWDNQMVSEYDGAFSCSQLKNNDPVVRRTTNARSGLQAMGTVGNTSGLAGCKEVANHLNSIAARLAGAGALVSGVALVPSVASPPLLVLAGALGLFSAAAWEGANITSKHCDDSTKLCNADVPYSGGVGQQTYYFQLGKAYGSAGLSYSFYSVPDRIVVRYEGNTLYDTGCSSGSNFASINFSGNSADIEVIVTGDCSNNGSTQWDFHMSCP